MALLIDFLAKVSTVRRALISDIHGNYEVLEAVLDDVKAQGIAEVFCLGAYSAPVPTRERASIE
jgi:hypothetical protein